MRRSRLWKIFILIVALVYLAASLTPYIDPARFWPLTFLALVFPYLSVLMAVIVFLGLLHSFKQFIFLLILFSLGFSNLKAVWGIRVHAKPLPESPGKENFRILSWNVNYFLDNQKKSDTLSSPRRRMLSFIRNQHPDILCFQDFCDYSSKDYVSNIRTIRDSLGFKYLYFPVVQKNANGNERVGVVIFSRTPILDSGMVRFRDAGSSECVAWADLTVKGKRLRVYTAHFRSMALHSDKAYPQNFLQTDTILPLHSSTLRRIKYFDKIHVKQAIQIASLLDTAHCPFIFCADLNSVPSSYVYHKISAPLKDAFLETGLGWGRTYDSIAPSLRIDVVLTSQNLFPRFFQTAPLHLSDHFPNIADISFKKEKY